MHLTEDAIPLGLRTTGQEVPQLLVHLGHCLVVSLLKILEQLLGLLNLHLAGLKSMFVETVSQDLAATRRFLNTPDRLSTALASFLHFVPSTF